MCQLNGSSVTQNGEESAHFRRHLPPAPPLSEHHNEENQAGAWRSCWGNKTGASHSCFLLVHTQVCKVWRSLWNQVENFRHLKTFDTIESISPPHHLNAWVYRQNWLLNSSGREEEIWNGKHFWMETLKGLINLKGSEAVQQKVCPKLVTIRIK